MTNSYIALAYHVSHCNIMVIEVVKLTIAIKLKKVKLATLVQGELKAPFSIATTPRCQGGRFSISWIAQLYP